MKKKITFVFMGLVLLLSLVILPKQNPVQAVNVGEEKSSPAASNDAYWDGVTKDVSWYNVYSAEFTLHTAAQFAGLMQLVNTNAYSFLSINTGERQVVKLEQDLYLNSDELPTQNVWTPVGMGNMIGFEGILDGQGHTIHNLYLNDANPYVEYQGLIGWLNKEGEVRNLTVNGTVVSGGNVSRAILVGYNRGAVKNCTVKGSLVNTTAKSTTAGVVGYNEGTIESCINYASVTSNGQMLGGIAGYTKENTTILNCDNYGAIEGGANYFGGVIGDSTGTSLKNCNNYGTVSGTGNYAGGIVGYATSGLTISNCTNANDIKVNGFYIGGIAGTSLTNVVITDCINENTIDGKKYVAGVSGYTKGSLQNCVNSGLIIGTDQSVGGIAGYATGAITLSNCHNKNEVNSSNSYVGGIVGTSSDNVVVSDCTNGGLIIGDSYVAGIVGYSKGMIQNCFNFGTVDAFNQSVGGISGYSFGAITQCQNEGMIGGSLFVGGIAGVSGKNSRVDQCTNKGNITGERSIGGIVGTQSENAFLTNSKNLGNVDGKKTLGGIVGAQSGMVSQCHNEGQISGSEQIFGGISGSTMETARIEKSDNSGRIIGRSNNGGLVGSNRGTIIQSYNTGIVNGNMTFGGIAAWNYGTIQSCYHIGTLVSDGLKEDIRAGGIAGINLSEIRDCYVSGRFEMENALGNGQVGGIVGNTTYQFLGADDGSGTAYTSKEEYCYYNQDLIQKEPQTAVGALYSDMNTITPVEDQPFVKGLRTRQMAGGDALNHMTFSDPSIWSIYQGEDSNKFYFPQFGYLTPSLSDDFPSQTYHHLTYKQGNDYHIFIIEESDIEGLIIEGNHCQFKVTPKNGYIQDNLTVKVNGTVYQGEGEKRDLYTLYNVQNDLNIEVLVNPLIPTVTFPTSIELEWGKTLAQGQLSGNVGDGYFVFADPNFVPTASGYFKMLFIPKNTTIYEQVEANVYVTVSQQPDTGNKPEEEKPNENEPSESLPPEKVPEQNADQSVSQDPIEKSDEQVNTADPTPLLSLAAWLTCSLLGLILIREKKIRTVK
ncbi:MAG: hypothetical protein ACLRVU_08440 [Beduini sp.]|uniref:hypothetical protein n=1 Tax=Beduini sp. TaxID=1922300 RepID=UPI00399F8661